MSSFAANCSLCGSSETAVTLRTNNRDYLSCSECTLLFVPTEQHISQSEERERYEAHENSPHDQRYRKFLSRLTDEVCRFLEPGAQGIDYGCGPGPTISVMLSEQGYHVENYDPFFAPDRSLLERKYDFVCCSETVEHFCSPINSFCTLFSLIHSAGLVGVMTQVLPSLESIADWYYLRDPTHVAFYTPKAMDWIAAYFDYTLISPRENVFIFRPK